MAPESLDNTVACLQLNKVTQARQKKENDSGDTNEP